jgi:F-type H+-transporting ATPase subunit delta
MSVAKSYAKALYEVAAENKAQAEVTRACDEIEKGLAEMNGLIAANRDLKIALESPLAAAREKVAIVADLSKKLGLSDVLARFMALLASKERLRLLAEITEVFRGVRLEQEGGVPGQLISAEPISEADVSSLAKAFSAKLGKRVAFTVTNEPGLLAGVKVVVNGVTYDGTLRSQLNKLHDQFVSSMAGRA